jgi:hypothetical protein
MPFGRHTQSQQMPVFDGLFSRGVAGSLASQFGNKMETTARRASLASAQAADLMVARGGIEPPTRGFSEGRKQLNLLITL